MEQETISEKPYARGSYNKYDDKEQWIRLSEGCFNDCQYCRETKECGKEPIYFDIPEIVRNKVKILDMNLLYKPKARDVISRLSRIKVNGKSVYYELTCGIDWRYLNYTTASLLKQSRFINIRLAWDYGFEHQYKIKDAINMLVKARYSRKSISVFMICDWKIPYSVCCSKLDLLKIWNVKVNDCWFNNVTPPDYQLNYWTLEKCKDFRKKCRKHNQMILFGIDPELKSRGVTLG